MGLMSVSKRLDFRRRSRIVLKADFRELIELVKVGEIDLEKIVMNPGSADAEKKSEYE